MSMYAIEEIMMLEMEEARRRAARAAAVGPGDDESEDDEDELRGREVVSDDALAAAWDLAFGY
jgi:hypothetical protein